VQAEERARIHAVLGDRHRLAIVDELTHGDRTFQELGQTVGLPGNLLAHHLGVLDATGLVDRKVSEGDQRRRYVLLRHSVCDRARESGLPFAAPSLHWSIPDPVRTGRLAAFRSAFRAIAERVDQLAAARA
jgi:DNA-binding transcriptional ArsR family regulator